MANSDEFNFDDNDFGFTFEDSADLPTKEEAESLETDFVREKDRAEELRDAIQPLLDNLKKNPEQDLIKWPNRVKAIEAFETKLDDIMTAD